MVCGKESVLFNVNKIYSDRMERKFFETDGIRGIYGEYPLTKDMVFRIGKAIPRFIRKARVVIGRDTRASGEEIERVLASGIISSGGKVISIGVVPTPAVAYFTKKMGADIGCVITASHNPAKYNGIKLFSGEGMKLTDEQETEIEGRILSDNSEYEEDGEETESKDVSNDYAEFLKEKIDCDLNGLKIIVDSANGSYYSIAGKVLEQMGAEVKMIFNGPDGNNINDKCGATDISKISDAVKGSGRIGIALDGDGDRVIMIDENGGVVDGDNIMGICALHMKDEGRLKGNGLVGTEYSNMGLEIAMKKNGVNFVRAKNGDRYVMEEMIKGGYNLGGEFSGHIIFMDKLKTGDGIMTALQVLEIMKETGKNLSELSACVKKYPHVLLNLEVNEKRDIGSMEKVKEKVEEVKEELGSDGRIIARYSGTEKVFRVMIEGKDKKRIRKMAESIIDEVRKEIGK